MPQIPRGSMFCLGGLDGELLNSGETGICEGKENLAKARTGLSRYDDRLAKTSQAAL